MRLRPKKEIQKRIGAGAPVCSPSLPRDVSHIRIKALNDSRTVVFKGVEGGVDGASDVVA